MIYPPLIRSQLGNDAPYAWFLFDRAKQNSRYRFIDLKEQAEQLDAYLDALGLALLAGEPVSDWLDLRDWGSLFVFATLGIRHGRPELFDMALDNLDEQQETHPRELLDACLWNGGGDLSPWLDKLLDHASPVAQQAVFAIARSIRQPLAPAVWQRGADHDNAAVRAQFLHWLGEQATSSQLPFIQPHYQYQDPDIAYAAARAGVLLGDPSAEAALRPFVSKENPYLLEAITLVFLKARDPRQTRGWVEQLWQSETIPLRAKLHAVAAAGLPEHIDKLFQPMTDTATSRAAGEAFTTLTGVDIEYQSLDAPDAENGCTDDTDDEDVTVAPTLAEKRAQDPFVSDWEDDLPYPCPDATLNWWQQNRRRFSDGTPYLAGRETTRANLQTVLVMGNQRQRQLAAVHLFIKHHVPWMDCGWPPAWQLPDEAPRIDS